MSDVLAFARVTEALRGLLENAMQLDLPYPIKVEARKPLSDSPANATITVFCYRVRPVEIQANRGPIDPPSRRVAYHMDVLISCYGPEADLGPQALLGAVARTLLEHPVLTQGDLESAAQRASLPGTDLGTARVMPVDLDLDDLSKLWSLINAPFTPSLAYQASLEFALRSDRG